MSLFQEYETKRKPFTAGKKWICVDAESIGFPEDSNEEIIEIIGHGDDRIRYKVLKGNFTGKSYTSHKLSITKGYKPYNGPIE